MVGLMLGFTLGVLVGTAVGTQEGAVGIRVGTALGVNVGCPVGSQIINEHEQKRCVGGYRYAVSHVPERPASEVGKLQYVSVAVTAPSL